MTGTQRLVAAMTGAPADRIPVFCNLIDQGWKHRGMRPREYFRSGRQVAEAQLEMRERYGYDNLWSLFYVAREAELMGCRSIVYSDDGPPNLGVPLAGSVEEIERLELPEDVGAHAAFEQTRECLRILRREAGGKYPICAYITSTMTLPVLLMGMEHWMRLLFRGPAGVRDRLLEKCHQFFVGEVGAYRQAGADVVLYSNPFGSRDTVPVRFFEEQALGWIERDIRAVGSDGVVYYCGGSRMNPVIGQVWERTGIGAYYLGPHDDVAEARAILAGRALCCGVINDIKLIDWTPAEVAAEVRRLIEAGKPGGKFLFGTLVMPLGIPEENIRAMLEAAYLYGSLTG